MKNLFVSFNSDYGTDNICIESDVKIQSEDDIIDLQKYIEMKLSITNVIVINFRRME